MKYPGQELLLNYFNISRDATRCLPVLLRAAGGGKRATAFYQMWKLFRDRSLEHFRRVAYHCQQAADEEKKEKKGHPLLSAEILWVSMLSSMLSASMLSAPCFRPFPFGRDFMGVLVFYYPSLCDAS